jgi:hypothetical protein
VAEHADDKVIISMNDEPILASKNLQTHLDSMEDWYNKWRFKINPIKSTRTSFTLRLTPPMEVTLTGVSIPSSATVKYLGITLDKRLI